MKDDSQGRAKSLKGAAERPEGRVKGRRELFPGLQT